MKFSLKFLAVLSALFVVSACETAPQDGSAVDGTGTIADGTEGTYKHPVTHKPYTEDSPEYLENNVGDRVFFAFDSSVVTSDGQRVLERQAAWLKRFPYIDVTIEGHADERGTREYNLALGERRANAAKKYLVSLGVDSSRISTVSYGKERPAVLGSTEEAWAQNRRAVTVVE